MDCLSGSVLKIPNPTNLESNLNNMKINLNKPPVKGEQTNTVQTKKGGVVMGRITTVRETIDRDGNIIDPRTKRIIRLNSDK